MSRKRGSSETNKQSQSNYIMSKNTLAEIPQEQSQNPFGNRQVARQSENAIADVEQARAVAETQGAMVIAKKFPRDQISAMDRILNACTRPTLAEGALYTYARGGTDISGPSIRLAEALAQNWGNIQFGIRELEQRGGESTVEAFAWDVETNTRQVKVFQVRHERHTRKGVSRLSDPRDVYELVANQGARRLRACILGIIPGDVVEAAVKQCETTLKTKADVTPERIQSIIEKFAEFKVTKDQIEKRIQRRLDAMTPAQVVSLGKIYNSMKDGMSSPGDWFGSADVMPAATSTPIDPFAGEEKQVEVNAEVADYSEPPPFVADTPQKQLQVALSDAGVVESKFMAAYRRQAKATVGNAKLISELSDEAAKIALDGIDDLIALAEEAK